MKEVKTGRNKSRQFSKYHSNFNMAAKMIFAQQSNYSDNTKNSLKFREKSRSIKIVPDLKRQDKTSFNSLTSLTPVEKNAKNIESSQNLPNKTEGGQISRGRIGRFRNAKLETRYRTNSTDSAFSEESFVDLDDDESTKLESLIDQLIFTDDRLNSDMSTYVKTEKLPATDTGILDISDLFNNTDIFTMDFESLAQETRASSFLEIESRPDPENTESTSSISSSDSGRESVYKFPAKMSSFLQCNYDKDLNDNNNFLSEKLTKFSSGLFISSDEEDVTDGEGRVVNKTTVSPHAYDTNRKDDGVHECSFVDLSTLLDVTPYGSPFSVGENLPRDSQRHLNTDDDVVCVSESSRDLDDFRDTYSGGSTNLRQVTSTNTTMSASFGITTKNNNISNNKSNNSQNERQLIEFNFCPVKEHKIMAPLPSIKNCPVKSIELSEGNFNKNPDKSTNDCDEQSQEPLYLYYLENLCHYSNQEMSGINQNNNFISDTCSDFENKFNFKKSIRETNSTDGQKFHNISKSKASEITFSNQKDTEDGNDDCKGFNGNNPLNMNDSVLCFGDKLDTIKLESHFPDSGFPNDIDAINNNTAQSSSQDKWILSNEEHVKGVATKDHSYRDCLPDKYEDINMSVIDTTVTSNKSDQMSNSLVKQNPAKRPLVKVLNSEKQHLSTPEENSSKTSSKSEFPGLKCLLEEGSSSAVEPIFYKSTNNTYYTFDNSDDSSCIKRKIPKFSVRDNDETRGQSAILYQVLAMEQNSPSTSPTFPPKVKTQYQSKFPSSRDFDGHCLHNLRRENIPLKPVMSMRKKDDLSEMKELEKYLRGIIPTESNDEQDETFIKQNRKASGIFFRRNRSPCSLLKKLLTGEITAQMYREIDQQFCENELLVKKVKKMN